MEIGITLEQFNNLKENLRAFGIDITYDILTNEWIPDIHMLVGALLDSAYIPQSKWLEIMANALTRTAMIEDLKEFYKQEHPNQDITFEEFLHQLKNEELSFMKEEEEEEEEEED